MTELAILLASFTSIISVVNPFAAMPAYIALTSDYTSVEREQSLRKAIFFMLIILLSFFFVGQYIMNFFGLSMEGMRIAGGIMIMQAGFSMLNTEKRGRKLTSEDVQEAKSKDDISFSPLAMPLLSGPGSIAVVLGLSSSIKRLTDYPVMITAICLTVAICYVVMKVSPRFVKFLGATGLNAMTRMMGFISLCIGVQFIINGILPLFNLN